MKLPPLNALRVFECAAHKGSFVAAGEELGVTSAAVSLQVRTLERWLGRDLFFRRNNQIRLTDAGEDLYRNAAQSLTDIAAFTQSVQQASTSRVLTISAGPSVAERWLPHIFHHLAHLGPIKIMSADDPFDLDRTGVDIHISYGHRQYPEHVKTRLFRDTLVPMAAPGVSADLSNLSGANLIEIDWGKTYTRAPNWINWCTQFDIAAPTDPIQTIATSTSMALQLAEAGNGVVLGQARLAEASLKRGTLRIVDQRTLELPSTYYAISAHHLAKNKRVQAALKVLQQVSAD